MRTRTQIQVFLNSWLLLTFPIMESLAFSSSGTMTHNQTKDGKAIRFKKVLVKRVPETYTPETSYIPPAMSHEITHAPPEMSQNPPEMAHMPHEMTNMVSYENDTLPTYHGGYHHVHHHNHHHSSISTSTTTTLPVPIEDIPTMPTTMNTKPKRMRVFGNFFPGTTAVIESHLKISIPIPFCQFTGSPCK